MKLRRRHFVALSVAALSAPFVGRAHAATSFRVSLDTSANHTRNIALRDFLAKLRAATNGNVTGEVFDGGSLFVDRDVPRAVARGDLDMAVPTTAVLAAFEPNMNIVQLPIFAGLSVDALNPLVDGPFGEAVNRRVGGRMGFTIPGKYLLLGFAHTYSTRKPIRAFADLRGMRIRIPGGATNTSYYRHFGAEPVSMPVADVPLALTQGSIDGLLTTDETIRSTKLWESGLGNGFVDRVAVFHYVPIVSQAFWRKMGAAEQNAFRDAWADAADAQRLDAMRRQEEAKVENGRAGVQYVDPGDGARTQAREGLLATTPNLVRELRIDQDLVDLAGRSLGQRG
jgi:C4-dicarboxylate-binding protein DctP